MYNNILLLFGLVGYLLFIPSCGKVANTVKNDKPNFLFLFTDDQNFETIQALGNSEIHTPNLDRLVTKGTSFTHAYNMGGWNGAVCVASRAMIISGRSIWRAKEFESQWQEKKGIEHTWAKIMEANGYDTYMTGKWHVKAAADTVFQDARHIRPGMPGDHFNWSDQAERYKRMEDEGLSSNSIMPLGYGRPLNENDNSWSPSDKSMGGFWEGGTHWSEVVKDDATDFLKIAANDEDPFMMYIAFNAPHDPRQAPEEFVEMYDVDDISIPKSFLPEYPYKDSIGLSFKLRDEALAPFPRTEYAVKTHIKEYYAIISHLDKQVGDILDALEATGKADNTYIFFSSDHGLSVGKHGIIGKQNMYDHSMRVPMIICGPDIPKNNRLDTEVMLQDIMASTLDLADISKPDYVEFNSLIDIAKAQRTESYYPAIYGAYIDHQRMIRKDDFKLIVYPRIEKTLLFDLANDPHEINDLSEQTKYNAKVKSLFTELIALQEHYEDPLDLSNMYNAL